MALRQFWLQNPVDKRILNQMQGLDWSQILKPLSLTLQVTLCSTFLALLFGVATGYAMSRAKFWGRNIADALLTLPMVLPPTVLGYYLIVVLGKRGTVGGFLYEYLNLEFIFQIQGAILAATVVSFPLVYKSSKAAFESLDPEYEAVARTLGKTGFSLFALVYLPLSWRGILAGAMMAYARGVGEFGATLMVAGNIPGKTQTLSLAIYSAVEAGNQNLSWILVGLASILCVTILVLSGKLIQRTNW